MEDFFCGRGRLVAEHSGEDKVAAGELLDYAGPFEPAFKPRRAAFLRRIDAVDHSQALADGGSERYFPIDDGVQRPGDSLEDLATEWYSAAGNEVSHVGLQAEPEERWHAAAAAARAERADAPVAAASVAVLGAPPARGRWRPFAKKTVRPEDVAVAADEIAAVSFCTDDAEGFPWSPTGERPDGEVEPDEPDEPEEPRLRCHRFRGEIRNVGGTPQMQGRGRLELSQESFYEGSFAAGKFHGEGTLREPNGETYVAQWVRGERRGKGKLVKEAPALAAAKSSASLASSASAPVTGASAAPVAKR